MSQSPRAPRTASRALTAPFDAASLVLAGANVVLASYVGVLTLAGLRRPGVAVPRPPDTRFLILVPAHDEAAVIEDTLASFASLVYPRDLFDVHVVADNCSDETAEIVRSHGWHAHERFARDEPGKGPALNWLFDRVDATVDFDAVVVVDADTVLAPDFLTAMDRAIAGGARVAQGYYSVKHPDSSAAAGIRYAALACRHFLRPLGRCRLGASSGLYGNGMAFRREVLRRRRWSGHLVEDAEFQMELLLRDGILVHFVPDARLEAEMPETLAASASQNERWERGRIELAARYVPELARSLPATKHRIATIDAIADHIVPPLSAVMMMQLVGVGLCGSVALATQSGRTRQKFTRRTILQVATVAVLASHVAAGLRSVAAPPAVYRSLVGAPKAVGWKVALWTRMLRSKNSVAWRRTQRNAET